MRELRLLFKLPIGTDRRAACPDDSHVTNALACLSAACGWVGLGTAEMEPQRRHHQPAGPCKVAHEGLPPWLSDAPPAALANL